MACTTSRRSSRSYLAIAGASLILALKARPVLAAANDLGACNGPSVAAEGVLSSAWIQAVEDVRARIRKNGDLDRCAELRLEARENALQVRVITTDGRTATRMVAAPGNLLSTVEALTELPPVLPPTPPPMDPRELPDGLVDQPRTAPPSPTSAHIEVGAGAAGRLASGPLYGGGGMAAFAQLTLDRWLIGVTARWDAVDDTLAIPSPSGFNMQTFGVGIGLGRRASFGDFNFDAVAGPEVIVESQEAEGIADGLGGTASDVRLDLLLRMSVPRAGRTRFYAGADADLSPSRVRRTKQLDRGLPPLPAWSGGLQIGILWGAR